MDSQHTELKCANTGIILARESEYLFKSTQFDQCNVCINALI